MDRQTVDALLTGMLESADGVSDLLFIAGKPPLVEGPWPVSAISRSIPPESVLTPALIEEIAGQIMNGSERLRTEFSTTGSCDCSYAIENLARFRVNVFKQNGRHAIVMRKLQSKIPTLNLLGLPPIFREIVKEKDGIILLTGGTGTGKTTTLAAMLNELNETQEIPSLRSKTRSSSFTPTAKPPSASASSGKIFPTSPTVCARSATGAQSHPGG